MSLQVLTPLDAALAEVRRVLRPGGVVVTLVPSSLFPFGPRPHLSGVVAWIRVMRALRTSSEAWPNPQAGDGLANLLHAHGFLVDSNQRCVFWREVADPSVAALMIDGLYLPGIAPASIARAKRILASWARPGRGLPIPLRGVVAHLPLVEPKES